MSGERTASTNVARKVGSGRILFYWDRSRQTKVCHLTVDYMGLQARGQMQSRIIVAALAHRNPLATGPACYRPPRPPCYSTPSIISRPAESRLVQLSCTFDPGPHEDPASSRVPEVHLSVGIMEKYKRSQFSRFSDLLRKFFAYKRLLTVSKNPIVYLNSWCQLLKHTIFACIKPPIVKSTYAAPCSQSVLENHFRHRGLKQLGCSLTFLNGRRCQGRSSLS